VPGAEPFADLLAANETYAQTFAGGRLAARAAKGLALLTCMDSRIEPLAMLGLEPGDAKILRNAGARVTDDVLATLLLASYLLGVNRVMVIGHTDCRMTAGTEEELHEAIRQAGGPDTHEVHFLTTTDVEAALRSDLQRLRSSPHTAHLAAGGFVYDVTTGRLRQVE
jgi:carbonic anhydrase